MAPKNLKDLKNRNKKKPATANVEPVKYNTLDMGYLQRAFDEFDKDESGFLDEKECYAALSKIGSCVSFEDLDTDKDGKISFDEFLVRADALTSHVCAKRGANPVVARPCAGVLASHRQAHPPGFQEGEQEHVHCRLLEDRHQHLPRRRSSQ